MSLLEKLRIIDIYNKNLKKSIHKVERMDIFLLIVILIVIISPFVIGLSLKLRAEIRQVNLFISADCQELLGIEITEMLLRDFNEKNPDLKINLLNIPDEKGREPDIFIFDDSGYMEFTATGALAQLNPWYEADTSQYALPLVSFMYLLFYNIDLLSNLGFDRPPKTREEFLAYAKTVSNTSNVRRAYTSGAAISLNPKDRQALSRDIFPWIWAAGGDFWSEGDTPALNARTAAADIAFFGSLYNEKAIASGIFEATGEQRLEEFARGRIALMIASSRAIPFFRERMGDDSFGITTIPGTGSIGQYNTGLSGIYAGINADCAYPEEAWSFLEYLAGQSRLFCEIFKAVPGVVSDIIPGEYVMNDPFYSKAQDIFEASVIVQGFSGNPKAQDYETAFLEELQLFFESGVVSVRAAQETVNAIQRKWDIIFSR